jgi:hypothetical protein
MKHEYRTEGSDYKHGALKMVAMCSCGWSGTVIDGQDNDSRREAKRQWDSHMQDVANEIRVGSKSDG